MNFDKMFAAESPSHLFLRRVVVLDANAALEIAQKGPKAETFRKVLISADLIVATEFLRIEVANVIQKECRGARLNFDESDETLNNALRLVHEFTPIEADYVEAMHEAMRLKHSAYDMLYLILARRYGATLMTLDDKLRQIAADEGITVC
jgi:predicted nucleic acid-binding protein